MQVRPLSSKMSISTWSLVKIWQEIESVFESEFSLAP